MLWGEWRWKTVETAKPIELRPSKAWPPECWKKCRDFFYIGLEFCSKFIAEQSFFYLYTKIRPEPESDHCGNQGTPVADRKTGCHQHAEHPGVNWMAHEAVGAFSDKTVSLYDTCCKTPLLAKSLDCFEYKPHRSTSNCNRYCGYNDFDCQIRSNKRREHRSPDRPDESVAKGFEENSQEGRSIAFSLRGTGWSFAEEESDGKNQPAENDRCKHRSR